MFDDYEVRLNRGDFDEVLKIAPELTDMVYAEKRDMSKDQLNFFDAVIA